MNYKEALKTNVGRWFLFPDYPDHDLNGAFAHSLSAQKGFNYDETLNGLPIRTRISTFEDNGFNNDSNSGYWRGEFEIHPDMFGEKIILKVQVYCPFEADIEDEFYLIPFSHEI